MDTDNSSEREIRGRLADNAGVSYEYTLIVDRKFRDWRVFDDGVRVGYAYCWFQGDEFAIKDWKFRDDLKVPLSWWAMSPKLGTIGAADWGVDSCR